MGLTFFLLTFCVHRFCERSQALIHGDLHTGSILVSPDSTWVIDPEFAFYGPMAFDTGAFVANLMLAYFSQEGHSSEEQPRKVHLGAATGHHPVKIN